MEEDVSVKENLYLAIEYNYKYNSHVEVHKSL